MGLNQTAGPSVSMPTNLLEATIPGFSVIAKVASEILGFDVTVVVTAGFLLVGLLKALRYFQKTVAAGFRSYFMSHITIEKHDSTELHTQILFWFATQNTLGGSANLMALCLNSGDLYNEDDSDRFLRKGPSGFYDFRTYGSVFPIQYLPAYQKKYFWHHGRFFELDRVRTRNRDPDGNEYISDQVSVGCVGWSTRPVKAFLQECSIAYFMRKFNKTRIDRPQSEGRRIWGFGSPWREAASRATRPLDTIALHDDQKQLVLRDINEYLSPGTRKWYVARGIPYRRGYLFHGAPGTGKTSFSYAIAGTFGLQICCLSLADKTIDEETLVRLFESLPARCVVLLEDIDTAGIKTRKELEKERLEKERKAKDADSSSDSNDSETSGKSGSTHKNRKKNGGKSKKERRSPRTSRRTGITMSGLLNAIDGVASHEGHILILTSNFPNSLDEALIRPGRIDMKLPFTLATKEQIRQLFLHIYQSDLRDTSYAEDKGKAGGEKTAEVGLQSESNLPHIPDYLNMPDGDHFDTPLLQTSQVMEETAKLSPASTFAPKQLSSRSSLDNSSPTTGAASTNRKAGSIADEDVELRQMAISFASLFEEGVFSPAEVQGYLLTKKNNPHKALAEVSAWIDSEMERKRAAREGVMLGSA